MKKIIISIFVLFLSLPAFSEPLEAGVSFDWISKTQMQRHENIGVIHDVMFAEKTVKKYVKADFKKQYEPFLKDTNHVNNYIDIANGKKEDADKKYAGFFWKNGLLVIYGIQYKNNMKNIYYYDAMGNLRYVDVFSDKYPEFPYYSAQYRINGELVGKFYFVSDCDQYIFSPDGKFKGRWYKENMYNRNAKIIMTRSNY